MYRSIFNPVNTWAENIKKGGKNSRMFMCVLQLRRALLNWLWPWRMPHAKAASAEQNQPYWAWCFAQGFLLTEWSQVAAQSDLCTARWLIRCVKDRPRLLLLLVCLMRCHCPAGWAGPDRRRGCSTVPKVSLCDFAWLMDCDWTQLQGCLCRVFAFFFFPHEASQCEVKKSVKHCWTGLMALNFHISRLGCTPGARSSERLKDHHCQQVKDSACTSSCFSFSTKRNLISLSLLIMSLYSMRAEKPTVGWF